jgi:hypothetical protein
MLKAAKHTIRESLGESVPLSATGEEWLPDVGGALKDLVAGENFIRIPIRRKMCLRGLTSTIFPSARK